MADTLTYTPITEAWSRYNWDNFTPDLQVTNGSGLGQTSGSGYPFGLDTQNHIDLCTFAESGWQADHGPITTGYQSAYGKWPGGMLSLMIGTNTYTLTRPAVDLTVLSSGNLTLALPGFPLSDIDDTHSYLDLSSDDFSTITSLRWADSSTTPISGSSTLTWAYATIAATTDLTAITNIRLRIQATSTATAYVMALRLIDPAWVLTNIDFDDASLQLRQAIPLTGDPNDLVALADKTLPPLWRTADTYASDDPKPIDGEISFVFHTGSQAAINSFTLYMRQSYDMFMTQSGLQGMTQAALSGLPQPVFTDSIPTTSSWIEFTVGWGNTGNSAQITNSLNPSGGYQYTLPTLATHTTYCAVCQLIGTEARLQIYNVDQATLALVIPPLFDTTVIPDSFMFPRLGGRVGFSSVLNDGDTYVQAVRPRGLVFAEYRSATLQSLTPVRGARIYSQQTAPTELFTSLSPLADSNGVEPMLTIDYQKYSPPDTQSYKVTVAQIGTASPPQGIITNILTPFDDDLSGITDFGHLHISFDLWISSNALTSSTIDNQSLLTMGLINVDTGNTLGYSNTFGLLPSPTLYPSPILYPEANLVIVQAPLSLPEFNVDQWTHVTIDDPFTEPYPSSGQYQLAIYYWGMALTSFWIDNLDISQYSIAWEGRSVVDDPWFSNYAPWTPFHTLINSDADGVLFTTQGTSLQMRAQALRQDVAISSPKLVPQYANLGRLVWPEDDIPVVLPTASFTVSHIGRVYTFNAAASTTANGVIGNYRWDFGDGNFGSGRRVVYTYSSLVPGGTQYDVTLTVLDGAGSANYTSATVTLS